MKKTCDHCGQEEIVLVSSMYWNKLEFRFVKCLACGTPTQYICTEGGDDLILMNRRVELHTNLDMRIAEYNAVLGRLNRINDEIEEQRSTLIHQIESLLRQRNEAKKE